MLTREPGEKLPRFSGEPRVLAEALNDISDAIEQTGKSIPVISGGKGVRVRVAKGSVIIDAVTQDTGGGGSFDFQFKTTLTASEDDPEVQVIEVIPGDVDDATSSEIAEIEAAAGMLVYADARYADAYTDTAETVTLNAVADGTQPRSHDTRRIVPIALIEGTPGALTVRQMAIGAQNSRRTHPRKSFDATRQANSLRIDAGFITAIVNPSFAQTINEAHATEVLTPPPGGGTLIMSIAVARTDEGDPAETSATFSVAHELSWETFTNTDQGLFVDVAAIEIPVSVTTVPGDPKTYAAGTLSPEYIRPSTVFRIPICDLTIAGDEWTIRQRQCGDIQLPLQTNWGWPATPSA